MDLTTANDGWNPRPDREGTEFNTRAYMCGYTDSWFDEPFGSHDRGQFGAFSAYRIGFNDAYCDKAAPLIRSARVAFALISEKARFHCTDNLGVGSNVHTSLGEMADIARTQISALEPVAKATGAA